MSDGDDEWRKAFNSFHGESLPPMKGTSYKCRTSHDGSSTSSSSSSSSSANKRKIGISFSSTTAPNNVTTTHANSIGGIRVLSQSSKDALASKTYGVDPSKFYSFRKEVEASLFEFNEGDGSDSDSSDEDENDHDDEVQDENNVSIDQMFSPSQSSQPQSSQSQSSQSSQSLIKGNDEPIDLSPIIQTSQTSNNLNLSTSLENRRSSASSYSSTSTSLSKRAKKLRTPTLLPHTPQPVTSRSSHSVRSINSKDTNKSTISIKKQKRNLELNQLLERPFSRLILLSVINRRDEYCKLGGYTLYFHRQNDAVEEWWRRMVEWGSKAENERYYVVDDRLDTDSKQIEIKYLSRHNPTIPDSMTVGSKALPTMTDLKKSLDSYEPRLFSIESPESNGTRKYIVSTYGSFIYTYYQKLSINSPRHYYELIREGARSRCYFDLEFDKAANSAIADKGNDLTLELLNELIAYIQLTLPTSVSNGFSIENMLILTSTTSAKFSAHVVVHFPNSEVFKSNWDVGVFVKGFFGWLCEERGKGLFKADAVNGGRALLDGWLFVHKKAKAKDQDKEEKEKKDPSLTQDIGGLNVLSNDTPHPPMIVNMSDTSPFIDLSVYTRNRLFRLISSSKFGNSKSKFKRSKICQFKEFRGDKLCVFKEKEAKNAPVNANHEKDSVPRTNSNTNSNSNFVTELLSFDRHAEALSQTLVTPLSRDLDGADILRWEKSSNGGGGGERDEGCWMLCKMDEFEVDGDGEVRGEDGLPSASSKSKTITLNYVPKSAGGNGGGPLRTSTLPSPYPTIDNWASTYLAGIGSNENGGVTGVVGTWSYDPTSMIMAYNMRNNRYCERIGRSHKSNNVLWRVSFKDKSYWQGCHDTECRMIAECGVKREVGEGGVRRFMEDVCFEDVLVKEEVKREEVVKESQSQGGNNGGGGGNGDDESYDSYDQFLLAAMKEGDHPVLRGSQSQRETNVKLPEPESQPEAQPEPEIEVDETYDHWLEDEMVRNPGLFP